MKPMSDEAHQTPIDWARPLVVEQAWVIHIRTGTVGRVARYYDGEGRVYEPRVEPAPSRTSGHPAMLELDGGQSFEASRDQFVRLSAAEARFYAGAVEGVKNMVAELAKFAVSGGMGQTMFEYLVGAAMRGQLTALDGRMRSRQDTIPTERPPAMPGIAPDHGRAEADDPG